MSTRAARRTSVAITSGHSAAWCALPAQAVHRSRGLPPQAAPRPSSLRESERSISRDRAALA